MKIIVKSILVTAGTIFLFSEIVSAQDTTIAIKTSAQCRMCKKRIEENINFGKGIKKAVLDVETKLLTVTYDTKKNTIEQLKLAVSKLGYDADEVAADTKAYKKLPKCCQKGGMKGK